VSNLTIGIGANLFLYTLGRKHTPALPPITLPNRNCAFVFGRALVSQVL